MRILVVGVGNELRRDDGLGPAVARALAERGLPEGVEVFDAGMSLYDVFLKLLGEPYDAVIFVDAVDVGEEPGTLVVVEPGGGGSLWDARVDAHGLTVRRVLELASSVGARPRCLLVGCQPEDLGPGTGLSPRLSSRLSDLVELVLELVEKLRGEEKSSGSRAHGRLLREEL